MKQRFIYLKYRTTPVTHLSKLCYQACEQYLDGAAVPPTGHQEHWSSKSVCFYRFSDSVRKAMIDRIACGNIEPIRNQQSFSVSATTILKINYKL